MYVTRSITFRLHKIDAEWNIYDKLALMKGHFFSQNEIILENKYSLFKIKSIEFLPQFSSGYAMK